MLITRLRALALFFVGASPPLNSRGRGQRTDARLIRLRVESSWVGSGREEGAHPTPPPTLRRKLLALRATLPNQLLTFFPF